MDFLSAYMDKIIANLDWWAALGFLAQAMFFSRFLVQWLHSERVKRSEIPVGFWFLSIAGGSLMLVYVMHLADAVLITGQLAGLLVYTRNLQLIFRERAARGSGIRPPAL